MAFDGFFTRSLVKELRENCLGGRITKIYQPFERELQIVIRHHRKNKRLSASIHPTHYHMTLTDEKTSNPTHAPMFCMLLRKHLENALILDIRQIDNDRIILFELSGLDELGDQTSYHLIFEMMGRHSNILLVNPEKEVIIDCIKHIPLALNSYRGLQPGARYIQPPRNSQRINPFEVNELDDVVRDYHDLFLKGKAMTVIEGMGKQASEQIAHDMTEKGLTAYQALQKLMNATQNPKPTLFISENHMDFYFMPYDYNQMQQITYDTLSRLMQQYYKQKIHQDRLKQISGDLVHRLTHILTRNNSKIEKLEQDKSIAENAELYRIKGELLSAYAYQLQKGMTEVELENYYTQEMVRIQLDKRLTPIENSQKYFKRYTKYRDALSYIQQQIEYTQQENDYIDSILVQLQQADIDDIEIIKDELIQQGYIQRRKTSVKKRSKINTQPRLYKSPEGIMIYVGRNNQQNDQLSLKDSAKLHWWLHAKNIPGSHVVIASETPNDETITLAAELAAYYSKFSKSAQVPVDMVQVKALRKPNGAKPGFVVYEGQKTLYVTPDENKLKQYEVKSRK